MRAAQPRRLTVEEFLERHAHRYDHAELVDGEIVAMAGGPRGHNRVQINLLVALSNRLDGAPCDVHGPDMGLRVDALTLRYPDGAVYCDPRDTASDLREAQLRHPEVVIEVLSPSTARSDREVKTPEYKSLPSTRCIALVDPETRAIELFERADEADDWRPHTLFPGQDLTIACLSLTIPATRVFAGV